MIGVYLLFIKFLILQHNNLKKEVLCSFCMRECYLCGATEDETVLYEGIYKSSGIVNVCRKCYFREKIPLIQKKELKEEVINSRESVRERLSRMAHVSVPKKDEKKIPSGELDVHLKDLVEKNFKKEVIPITKKPEDLIDNFNWIIMRKRRSRKISREKLAEVLREPLIAIESLEKGILPKDYKPLIKKIEGYLGVNLSKSRRGLDHKDIIVESKVPTGILVSELKKKTEDKKEEYLDASNLSLDKINEVYGVPEKETIKKEERGKVPEKKGRDRDELTDEDISKMVWGR